MQSIKILIFEAELSMSPEWKSADSPILGQQTRGRILRCRRLTIQNLSKFCRRKNVLERDRRILVCPRILEGKVPPGKIKIMPRSLILFLL